MKQKIRVAFIFHKDNIFLTGKHFDNTYYNFFIKSLGRTENLDYKPIPTGDIFNCEKLRGKFDIILLWENSLFGMPKELVGIKNLEIPIIAKCGDPIRAKKSRAFHEKWNISYYFHFFHKDFFYELYPRKFRYKTIIFGLESSLYKNVKPFNLRRKDKILLTGAIASKGIPSKILNYIRSPKWNANKFYKLRNSCSNSRFVDYTTTLNHKYINDEYPMLLEKYASSVVAATYNPCIKYWENTAAGCLTFMEITKKNRGNYIGFIDGVSSVFINEHNYKEKFNEFISDRNNPKWEKIANEGRQHALNTLNNEIASKSLELLMKDLI